MIKPLGNRVLIKRDDKAEAKTAAGIILTADVQQDRQTGVVVEVGPGRYTESGTRITPDVKSGDRIIFEKFAGTKVAQNGENFLMINEQDIIAIIE